MSPTILLSSRYRSCSKPYRRDSRGSCRGCCDWFHARVSPLRPSLLCAPFVRGLFISVKPTPNPDVQKFLPTPPMTVLPEEFGHTMVGTDEANDASGVQ